jgi:hypothetical protein
MVARIKVMMTRLQPRELCYIRFRGSYSIYAKALSWLI